MFDSNKRVSEFKTYILNLERLRVVKLNKYFSREEFACKCGCGFATVDAELLEVLTAVREHFNSPVTINSACRCCRHNATVGGKQKTKTSSGSKHMYGIAADIVVKGVNPDDVYLFLFNYAPNKYGLGAYETFTHIDVRAKKARF